LISSTSVPKTAGKSTAILQSNILLLLGKSCRGLPGVGMAVVLVFEQGFFNEQMYYVSTVAIVIKVYMNAYFL